MPLGQQQQATGCCITGKATVCIGAQLKVDSLAVITVKLCAYKDLCNDDAPRVGAHG